MDLANIPDTTAVICFNDDGTMECRIPSPPENAPGGTVAPVHILLAAAIATAVRDSPELIEPMLVRLKGEIEENAARRAHGRAH